MPHGSWDEMNISGPRILFKSVYKFPSLKQALLDLLRCSASHWAYRGVPCPSFLMSLHFSYLLCLPKELLLCLQVQSSMAYHLPYQDRECPGGPEPAGTPGHSSREALPCRVNFDAPSSAGSWKEENGDVTLFVSTTTLKIRLSLAMIIVLDTYRCYNNPHVSFSPSNCGAFFYDIVIICHHIFAASKELPFSEMKLMLDTALHMAAMAHLKSSPVLDMSCPCGWLDPAGEVTTPRTIMSTCAASAPSRVACANILMYRIYNLHMIHMYIYSHYTYIYIYMYVSINGGTQK